MQLYLEGDSAKLILGTYSIGNLGGSVVHCEHKKISLTEDTEELFTSFDFTCPNSPNATINLTSVGDESMIGL